MFVPRFDELKRKRLVTQYVNEHNAMPVLHCPLLQGEGSLMFHPQSQHITRLNENNTVTGGILKVHRENEWPCSFTKKSMHVSHGPTSVTSSWSHMLPLLMHSGRLLSAVSSLLDWVPSTFFEDFFVARDSFRRNVSPAKK